MKTIHKTIAAYNRAQRGEDKVICETLKKEINGVLSGKSKSTMVTSKIWHGGPV